jgi:hypothetical protein
MKEKGFRSQKQSRGQTGKAGHNRNEVEPERSVDSPGANGSLWRPTDTGGEDGKGKPPM